MIVGIGCDIVEIARVDAMLKRHTNIPFLTKKENVVLHTFHVDKRKAQWLAGRFAAKEAIYKAIHKVHPCTLFDIEVLCDEDHAPICVLNGYKVHISIAHESEYAIAYAMIEKEL